ncbi:CheY-like chemotaxis protein [Flavobacterium sp. CG_9.10]|uniref:response regulator n=1 Tax=Flavobacterium sp. CG_9.10 TaxID=2787729 RepID=UPI0018CAE0F9|nr:response regulator [Flavobacterium sp. CG_9.10]MBG6110988.1 CheY-like chemotaxis protein [Flavobacterium sp. CG_9.10]
MKILLVEDDEDKREQLINFIIDKFEFDFKEARSYQSGLKMIKEEHFDLILLDMTMPTFDITPTESGGRSQPFGGELLLYEMLRREIDSKVIVVTQFDVFGKGDEEITIKDLDLKLSELFKFIYLGIVQYNISYTGWKDNLYRKIKENEFNIN